MQWIPEYVGIIENEVAGTLAKEARQIDSNANVATLFPRSDLSLYVSRVPWVGQSCSRGMRIQRELCANTATTRSEIDSAAVVAPSIHHKSN
ncbi:hypothetical protein TNCV_1245341 [Trichonephila clavipes]|nr:hypothetical protein TNCV_1245341 [Trichonephila clavipes]